MSQTQEEMRATLIKLLKSHDWYYDRSDDHGEYTKGRKQREQILSLVRQLPDGEALYAARGKGEV